MASLLPALFQLLRCYIHEAVGLVRYRRLLSFCYGCYGCYAVPTRYGVIGPPGCGKTTYLQRQVERAAKTLGSSEVMVCSLTKAAAAEVKGRELPIQDSQVGTLHSFAYRAIGCPKIAETKLKAWNDAHPRWKLSAGLGIASPEEDRPDDRGDDDAPGDQLYEDMNILRHGLRDRQVWPAAVRAFADAWDGWLREDGMTDFTGMIETAVAEVDHAPGRPLAMFCDEAQDMSRLEVSLVQKWAQSCATVVAVGDDAQALYEWRGADPRRFLDVGDGGSLRVLSQSYRVPEAAHALAVRWAGKLLRDVEYAPTDQAGSIATADVPLKYGEAIAEMAETHLKDEGSGTLMIQALCSYMLRPALSALRERGIPFHNPMRVARADWNPLGARKGTSTLDRLRAFMDDEQDAEKVAAWLPMLRSDGVLARGAKERIKDALPADPAEIVALFASEDVASRAFSGDIAWLRQHVTTEYAKRLDYPLAVARARGADALGESPRVMIGTIHSFKGGQAEHVVVAPDLSPAAWEDHVLDRPAVRRAFYVALTRTMDRLTLLAPGSKRCAWLQ